MPFVARGSGTGLSGGALPREDGVLIVTSRMRRILEIDLPNRAGGGRAGRHQPGDHRGRRAPHGYYYAPDPSSQQICSIGGNVAENSGGAHCLKYGFTVNHVDGLRDRHPRRRPGDARRRHRTPGYDLLGAFVGSEGTLGIATKITVRLMRAPEAVTTLLAAFETHRAGAARPCRRSSAPGIVPAAIEMMDALAIEAAEAAVACGYPDGRRRGADRGARRAGAPRWTRQFARLRADLLERRVRAAGGGRRPAERAAIWKGRKSAFAAVGRISPAYIVQDGVVPAHRAARGAGRDRPAVGRSTASGWPTSSTPATATCTRWCCSTTPSPGQASGPRTVSGAILDLCIEHGGSITGEHGVGVDKAKYMPRMFSADDLDTMQLVRCAFDPRGLANPGKVFPTPRLCGEVPGVRKGVHPLVESGRAEQF